MCHCVQSCNLQAVDSSFLLVDHVAAQSIFGSVTLIGRWMSVNI